MTITEAHRLFRLSLDKMDGLNYPNFRTEEIDVLLNQAFRRWVKQRYGHNNPKRLGVDEDQKRRDDLKELIKEKQYTLPTFADNRRHNNLNVQSWEVTLESDYWFMIYERALIVMPSCNQTVSYYTNPGPGFDSGPTTTQGTYMDVIPTSHLELNKVLKDPFKQPDNTQVLRLELDGKVEIIPPQTAISGTYIYRYIKKPTDVSLSGNITFETSDHTHDEIVAEAVKIALEGIEAKRIQTFPIIDNTKE
jgi:hypothetical protein